MLGGVKTLPQPSSKDADDIKRTGCYQSLGLSNIPSASGGNLLICIRGSEDYMIQIFCRVTVETTIYARTGIDREGFGWLGWKLI